MTEKSLKVKLISINKIFLNKDNPRIIKDEKFAKLVKSIKEFPKMLEIRPIVVNDDMIVLGGNMRLKACKEAGLKEVPVIKASELTEEEQRRFIIADNVGYGEWDWEMLANNWEAEQLKEWGLDVWQPSGDINLDEFFEDNGDSEKEQKFKIVLEYTEEEYNEVIKGFSKHSGSKENIVYKLLV
jgi:hypothetical protein